MSTNPVSQPHRFRPAVTIAALVLATAAAASSFLGATSASAHGFSSTAYVDVNSPAAGTVRTDIELEYDLLVVSAAEYNTDDAFFTEGMDLFETGDEEIALNNHADTVLAYIGDHFSVSSAGEVCEAAQVGDITVHVRDDVPYAQVTVDHACDSGDDAGHELRSSFFPDDEGYVVDTKTIVTYNIDGRTGSAPLDAANPTFSTVQGWTDRFVEFFLLGAEHLLGGLDHILFLLALIVGSRRLRDVVLAATTFTVAHSVTFLLAALGLVTVPAAIVEPIIALSIAVVAAWYLWGAWRRRSQSPAERAIAVRTGPLGLDRADLLRLAVVFCFGLIHGLGFASALGIEEAFSWTLLWSLLVFNVGIEAVQLGIIAIVFPLLALLRRRAPRVGLWVGVALTALVTVVGLFWFFQRILGLG